MLDQIERRILRENYDKIDAFECGKHICALGIGTHGTPRTLEATDRLIAVDTDDQRVGSRARRAQHVDVSGMEQVEHAVGERDPTLFPRSPALSLNPSRDLLRRIPRLQSLLTAEGWKWSTYSFFSGSLMISS